MSLKNLQYVKEILKITEVDTTDTKRVMLTAQLTQDGEISQVDPHPHPFHLYR